MKCSTGCATIDLNSDKSVPKTVSIQMWGPGTELKPNFQGFRQWLHYPVLHFIKSMFHGYLWQYLVTWGDEHIQVASLLGFIWHSSQSDGK